MKLNRIPMVTVVVALMCVAGLAQGRKPLGQDVEQQYLVSARAGIVNIVEGDVWFRRGDSENKVVAGDELQSGDVVRTSPGGRVEVLLMPGAYLRLSENTECGLSDNSLESLKLQLLKGSVIVEAATVDDWKGTLLTMSVGGANLSIVHAGIYRFNAAESGHAEALVLKGKMMSGASEIKEGKKADLSGSSTQVVSFDKRQADTFDTWSKDRARTLVAANKNIPSKSVGSAFANSYMYSPGYSWFDSFWFFNPGLGFYTFLPGDYGFYSPYGFGYGSYYPYAYYWWPSVGSPAHRPSHGRTTASSGHHAGGIRTGPSSSSFGPSHSGSSHSGGGGSSHHH
jgi:hypothetical protein